METRSSQTGKIFRLLLIDDNKQVLVSLYDYLRDLNYDVVSAEDGLQGLQLIENAEQEFDLVITDLVMPKVSGNYLILIIKKKIPDIPIIAITGYGAYPEAFASETQADVVLEKPFELEELERTIKELLSSKSS